MAIKYLICRSLVFQLGYYYLGYMLKWRKNNRRYNTTPHRIEILLNHSQIPPQFVRNDFANNPKQNPGTQQQRKNSDNPHPNLQKLTTSFKNCHKLSITGKCHFEPL